MEEKKVIDIYPTKKTRRVLSFLGDFFINFILTIFIFNMIVLPIAKYSSSYKTKYEESRIKENQKIDMLYKKSLLFYEEEEKKYNFTESIEITGKKLISYHIYKDDLSKNVFYTYFSSIGTEDELNSLYESNIGTYDFFDFNSLDQNGIPNLKEEYVEEFSPMFDSRDEMGEKGKKDYDRFINKFFLNCYYDMIDDIRSRDLIVDGISYLALEKSIEENTKFLDFVIVISSYVSFIVSSALLFVLYPLLTKKGKTLMNKIMKEEIIYEDSLKTISPLSTVILALYRTVACFGFILFVPYPSITFNYLFRLDSLYIVALFGLGYVLMSLLMMFISKFNRSISNVLTKTVVIDTSSLDEIYRAKGYLVEWVKRLESNIKDHRFL